MVQRSKARSQDPLADGIERYVGLEHLDPGDLRIRSWGNVPDGVIFNPKFKQLSERLDALKDRFEAGQINSVEFVK